MFTSLVRLLILVAMNIIMIRFNLIRNVRKYHENYQESNNFLRLVSRKHHVNIKIKKIYTLSQNFSQN